MCVLSTILWFVCCFMSTWGFFFPLLKQLQLSPEKKRHLEKHTMRRRMLLKVVISIPDHTHKCILCQAMFLAIFHISLSVFISISLSIFHYHQRWKNGYIVPVWGLIWTIQNFFCWDIMFITKVLDRCLCNSFVLIWKYSLGSIYSVFVLLFDDLAFKPQTDTSSSTLVLPVFEPKL